MTMAGAMGGGLSGAIHDTGGMLKHGNYALNLSGKPEYVLDQKPHEVI